MKLHQQVVLQEMTGPIPFELTLKEIIDAGDTTNHYQIYVLAMLSRFFKDGMKSTRGMLDGLPTLASDATSVKVINSIKELTAEEKVSLATYLLSCVEMGESYLFDSGMTSTEWIQYVLRRQ